MSSSKSNTTFTFRALFDAQNNGPKVFDAFVETLKDSQAENERGWLCRLCREDDSNAAFAYVRAVLASRLDQDDDLEKALQAAWGCDDVAFHPQDLFPLTMELQPSTDVVQEMESNPIAYIQNVLADPRIEPGWLRQEIFPKGENSMKDSEKRMLRLQACLLMGLGIAPSLIQDSWGLSMSSFHSILMELQALFHDPVVTSATTPTSLTAPIIFKRRRPSTPIGYMTRLFVPSNNNVTKTGKYFKESSSEADMETDPSTQTATPSPDHEATFFNEGFESLETTPEAATSSKTPQSMLRKTVASVLSPFRKSKEGATKGLEDSVGSLEIFNMNLQELPTPMSTGRADDGVSIEIAFGGDEGQEDVEQDSSPEEPEPLIRVFRIDLNHLGSNSASDPEITTKNDDIVLQLKELRDSFETDNKHSHCLEVQMVSQTVSFCQVVPSNTFAEYEENATLYGWLDNILERSVVNGTVDDAAKHLLSFLGEKHPQALAIAAENIGFMRVVGPEL